MLEKVTIKRNVLLNPGPVTTTDTVKKSMLVPDICHREAEFAEVLLNIRNDLLRVVNANKNDFTSVIFTASGTGAVESCLSSAVPNGKKIAIINNGSYGQRMINIANRYNIPVVEIHYDFEKEINAEEVDKILSSDESIACLAMVHHETSTGLLNPIEKIGEICHQNQVTFIVDAMSSFAGVPIDVKKSHIDFIISSSNKCLHGMPGMSFVICNKEKLLATKDQARSYYFDLYQQYNSLETTGQMPFTPPVQVAYAFRQALKEYFQYTPESHMKRYQENYNALVAGLRALGFKLITPEDRQSGLLATIQYPETDKAFDFDHMHDFLFEKGFTIYPNKLPIKNTFRLACLGDLNVIDINNFIGLLDEYLKNFA